MPKIIVDIDGTLASKGDRSPYDYSKISEDSIVVPIREIVNIFYKNGYDVIVVSGRPDSCRKETEQWLGDKKVKYSILHMRRTNDNRDDSVIKKEIYENCIKKGVLFVLDDRDIVVKMWRDLGLKCLQVAEGNF